MLGKVVNSVAAFFIGHAVGENIRIDSLHAQLMQILQLILCVNCRTASQLYHFGFAGNNLSRVQF